VSLGYTAGKTHMTEVNLAGRDLGTLSGTLSIEPWQIKTIKFERLVEGGSVTR